MSEATRQKLGYRRVPLSQHSRVAEFGRSGRLKPYWGKPAEGILESWQEVRQGGVLRAPPIERGGNGATVHLNYGACRLLDNPVNEGYHMENSRGRDP